MDGPQSSTMSSIPVKLMNSTGGTNFNVTHRVAESIECIGVVNDRCVCVCVCVCVEVNYVMGVRL